MTTTQDEQSDLIERLQQETHLDKDVFMLVGAALIVSNRLHMLVADFLDPKWRKAFMTGTAEDDAVVYTLLGQELGKLKRKLGKKYGEALSKQFDELVATRNSIAHGIVVVNEDLGRVAYVHIDREKKHKTLNQDDLYGFIRNCNKFRDDLMKAELLARDTMR